MNITKILVNHRENALGIGDTNIHFSWQIESAYTGMKQKRYDIQLAIDKDFGQVIWHQNEWSDQSTNVLYTGPGLLAKHIYYVRVKSMNTENIETDWAVTHFETGILDEHGWAAEWVTTAKPVIENGIIKPFTAAKQFAINKEVLQGRIYISALGIYLAELNNEKVGNDYFTPGWTDYNDRVQHQVYDITQQLQENNEIRVTVAEGWFTGYLGWEKKKNTYGNFNACIVQIELDYKDGTKEIIASDGSWREINNRWVSADLYNGEEQTSFVTPEINAYLTTVSLSKQLLTVQENEPVRRQENIQPTRLFEDPSGRMILDMGQNMVGWVQFTIKGEAGQIIHLIHGEVLDKDGNFYRGNIRDAQQKDTYTLSGKRQSLAPMFTFHGFRYVHLENFPENTTKDDFTGIVLHSDMKETGTFETSDSWINQLHHNIVWGQKGNFLDVPTDCPQRDERLGWTADAQIFFPTASYNMNTYQFFEKWLRDLRYAQMKNGAVPFVVPDVLKGVFADNAARTTAAWGDAATIIPWEMYQRFGNPQILADSFDSMRSWVDYIRGQGTEEALWNTGLQLGDWLALDAEEGSFFGATDETLVATCYFAYSTKIVSDTAKVLGKYQEYKQYKALYKAIKQKIVGTFFDGHRLISDTQTAHILVLRFHLYPEQAQEALVQRLVTLIELKDSHLDTGFIGSPYICQVLSDYGHLDLAYQLLFNKDLPSWLYQVEKGATTVWEHWDGIKNDGTFWDDGMNSFNHYAYGSVGIWMYEQIAGIKKKTPGYKQSIIAPTPTSQLRYCDASFETLYGVLAVRWEREAHMLALTVKVPENTEAEIVLPQVAKKAHVSAEIKALWKPIRIGNASESMVVDIGITTYIDHQSPCEFVQETDDTIVALVGSGTYQIKYELESGNDE